MELAISSNNRRTRHARFHSEINHLDRDQDPEDSDSRDRPNSAHSGPEIGQNGGDQGKRSNNWPGRRAPPPVLRTKSDFGPRHDPDKDNSKHSQSDDGDEDGPNMRHGWETQLTSEEQATALSQNFFMYWTDKRHDNFHKKQEENVAEEWRMRDRLKTIGALLAVCLNIGVDPPDIVKTDPCARLECWIDPVQDVPQGQGSAGVNTAIGKALQSQFENLSMRTRYKMVMDPSVDDMKKFCTTLRRTSKDERVLFHYNGHGVPRPTPAGEIWVFNRHFTQYIPISLYDLQTWLGAPGLYLYDCSAAGLIIKNFDTMAIKHDKEQQEARRNDPSLPYINFHDSIHLAACREKEILPTNPDLPADLFTSCLTTPIDMAVRFFILQNPLPGGLTLEEGRNIPGKISERRTPLGELNWIFTAITDTIAWNSLPKPLFKKLFRQDLMVAALFRNFLLAQRVMRAYHCHPQSQPEIPDTHDNPLWSSWDYAVEMILKQLPGLVAQTRDGNVNDLQYNHSDFFADQLSAFDVYLTQGALEQKMPEQLPIVLQVLLSQVHRLRALVLLSKFLDLGPWAVNLALSIGIFPYVLKLLQSQAQELKSVMVFIWARILAIDQTCQADLLKDNGYQYFVNLVNPSFVLPNCPNIAEHRAMCAFIIAIFCKDYRQGQAACLNTNPEIIEFMLFHAGERDEPLLRQYACLCLSMLWKDHTEAKWAGIRAQANQALARLCYDPVPEVRTAMVNAMTNFIGIPDLTDQVAEVEAAVAESLVPMADDGNVMVRREYVVFLSTFVFRYRDRMVVATWEELVNERKRQRKTEDEARETVPERKPSHSSSESHDHRTNGSHIPPVMPKQNIYLTIWRQALVLSADPHPDIAQDASVIVDFVLDALFNGPLGKTALQIVRVIAEKEKLAREENEAAMQRQLENSRLATTPAASSPLASSPNNKNDGYFAAGLRRTASVAASISNLAKFGSMKEKGQPTSPTPSNRSPPKRPNPRAPVPHEWTVPSTMLDPTPSAMAYPEARPAITPGFIPRDLSATPMMPLASNFLSFSLAYFREPQMRPAEADEPGSTDFNERIWRRSRNDRIIASTQPLKDMAATGRWSAPSAVLSNNAPISKIVFHQFEPHVLLSDDRETITVWDWEANRRVSRWRNENPKGSRISDLRFVNEDDVALVLAGSSDGVVRIYKDYDNRKVELAASFRALTDLVPSTINSGCVCEWQQGQGRLLVAGDVKMIRVWSAATELCVTDIPARSGSNITSLTSDQVEGNIFAAGFGDGAIRIFDARCKPGESMVRVYKDHRGWIVGCHLQRGGMRELISAERAGPVRLWDIRMDKHVGLVNGKGGGGAGTLRSLSVHEHAPVFATGTSHNALRVFSTTNIGSDIKESSKPITTIEPGASNLLSGSTHNRATPITATAFHPHRMMLACSVLGEGQVNIFKCVSRDGRSTELRPKASTNYVREWDS
ncbi:raptor N-terminal caspase like domain-containing protein [Elsinoe ampelina]|uniref:Raptor N-terminal caspase like domain-containing protein n=1 Tax=Elsinoe ampelina TaxID=302913 RepID=A0A6A6G398_9PEZI|nr:raptor N-terminal caspase like domain-containing protein [Elsinoe ampelina]